MNSFPLLLLALVSSLCTLASVPVCVTAPQMPLWVLAVFSWARMGCLVSIVVVLKLCRGRIPWLSSVCEVIPAHPTLTPLIAYFEIEFWTQFSGDFFMLSFFFSFSNQMLNLWILFSSSNIYCIYELVRIKGEIYKFKEKSCRFSVLNFLKTSYLLEGCILCIYFSNSIYGLRK